jgi:hypothetical protein
VTLFHLGRALAPRLLVLLLSIGAPAFAQGMNRDEDPHASLGMGQRSLQNSSGPDSGVNPKTVVVEVLGPTGDPVVGAHIELHTHFQSVAQGNSSNVAKATSNAQGEASFTGLDDAIRFSYGVTVIREGATYDIPPFPLSKVGHRVRVQTFPVTKDPKEALVGLQGFISVGVREDLFRIDGVYRVVNMGSHTWRPDPIFLRLPSDAQAVEAKISSGDSGFEESEGGLKLVGSYPPGQKDIPFSFHVPNLNEENRVISIGLPPHMVDFNVLTEHAPGLELSVSPGFDTTEKRTGRDQKEVLITRRVMKPGEGQLTEVRVELRGLPVVGPGRWVAAVLALLIALLGLAATLVRKGASSPDDVAQQDSVRDTLLREILLLETARQRRDIGPRMYEQTKREILVALARLEPDLKSV